MFEDTMRDIQAEAERSAAKYGMFTSTHEALGVLTEEYYELIEAVRANDFAKIWKEAQQVSAVAARLADQSLQDERTPFAKRSGA